MQDDFSNFELSNSSTCVNDIQPLSNSPLSANLTTKESLPPLSVTNSSTASISEKSISSVIMPSSTATFLASTADSSLGSENTSENSTAQQGNGSDFVEPKKNGKVALMEWMRLKKANFNFTNGSSIVYIIYAMPFR